MSKTLGAIVASFFQIPLGSGFRFFLLMSGGLFSAGPKPGLRVRDSGLKGFRVYKGFRGSVPVQAIRVPVRGDLERLLQGFL